MTESTLNEYIHTHTIIKNRNSAIIDYEPVENLPMGSIMGVIHFSSKKKPITFSGAIIPIGPTLIGGIVVVSDLISMATYCPRTGVIKFDWNCCPEDHFLQVSYKFGESVQRLLDKHNPTLSVFNWKKEGF